MQLVTAVPKRKRFKNNIYLFHKILNCTINYVYDKMLLVSITEKIIIDVLLGTGPMVYHPYPNRLEYLTALQVSFKMQHFLHYLIEAQVTEQTGGWSCFQFSQP